MDIISLARFQFAMTAIFHFLFVPLTLGLAPIVAFMETRHLTTGNEMYERMAKFWGKLFIINFALGVVTGLTMEFQFGMNWARYSAYVGDIFGAPLAIEAFAAFFLESIFIGLWIFGRGRISKKLHVASIWIVAFAVNLSAFWILFANGWMQHPVGYEIQNGRAIMTDFTVFLTNSYSWSKFLHTMLAGFTTASFFVLGISAWHLLRKNETEVFTSSFKIAAVFGLASSFLVFVMGDFAGGEIAKVQPEKLAAMESHWETARNVPFYLFVFPDEENSRNVVELFGIPGMVSFLSFKDFNAEVKGLRDWPKEDRPPVLPVFAGFRLMVGLGMLFMLLSAVSVFIAFTGRAGRWSWFLKLLPFVIPLPYIAAELGWIVAEMGRQPWIVYRVMRTTDAVSPSVGSGQVMFTIISFVFIYGLLAALDIFLLAKSARKGPEIAPAKGAAS
ncbi:MAG TPA: cytochrome ubiquinol oxidase subunit I [Desulfomonilia bacterium]